MKTNTASDFITMKDIITELTMCFLARIMAALQVASWDTLVCVMNLFWAPETNTDMQLYTSVSANKNCYKVYKY